MKSVAVKLIAISRTDWENWPSDRALGDLTGDALAMQRRAAKGVNVSVERCLFLQLARRIDSLALRKMNDVPECPPCSFDRESAAEYVALKETLIFSRDKEEPVWEGKEETAEKSPRKAKNGFRRFFSRLLELGKFFRRERKKVEQPEVEVPSKPRQVLHPFAGTFYPPGEEVRKQQRISAALVKSDLVHGEDDTASKASDIWKELLIRRAAFYDKAAAADCGVVEVLHWS